MRVDLGQGHVDEDVEDAAAVGPGQFAHALDEGAPRATAALGRVDGDRDFDAVEVVTERELHEAHAENRPVGFARGQQGEPSAGPLEAGEGLDVAPGPAAQVRPQLLVDGLEHGVPLGQRSVVVPIDLSYLHPTTMPRPGPIGGDGRSGPGGAQRAGGALRGTLFAPLRYAVTLFAASARRVTERKRPSIDVDWWTVISSSAPVDRAKPFT